jgi:hypothetical protein
VQIEHFSAILFVLVALEQYCRKKNTFSRHEFGQEQTNVDLHHKGQECLSLVSLNLGGVVEVMVLTSHLS